jgi:hypothetical protein
MASAQATTCAMAKALNANTCALLCGCVQADPAAAGNPAAAACPARCQACAAAAAACAPGAPLPPACATYAGEPVVRKCIAGALGGTTGRRRMLA